MLVGIAKVESNACFVVVAVLVVVVAVCTAARSSYLSAAVADKPVDSLVAVAAAVVAVEHVAAFAEMKSAYSAAAE